MTYSKYLSGSEWRRWDLHIHTPGTMKADRFTGATLEEKWNNYIADINASTEDVRVIGVTDYFSLQNYFKFKKLVEDNTITKDFDLIIPNIELRILPVASTGTPVNIHCIFNSALDGELQARFLAKLEFNAGNGDYSAHPDELIRLGKNHTGNQSLKDDEALKAGVDQAVIGMRTLHTVFKNDPELRQNTIIVVSNRSTDGASGLNHKEFFTGNASQLDATRQSIYHFSDAIFSANPSDVLYFTGDGVDDTETVLKKCGTLMPCLHGCDAHANDRIFKPVDNRFCWIKADPTFEGLKQTLYEPIDRVKIQALKPDVKNDRFVISKINFSDKGQLFGSQKIELNGNLNSLIGGKSSGKSLLLYSIAKSIDPEQVDRLSQKFGFDGYDLGPDFEFEVIWRDGEVDKLSQKDESLKVRKITYIPQLYINHLVEKNNKKELNILIESILVQDPDFKKFYDQKKSDIQKSNNDIDSLISSYFQIRGEMFRVQTATGQIGKSESIKKGIDGLQQSISDGQKTSNLNATEFAEYERLMAAKSKALIEQKGILDKEEALTLIEHELVTTQNNLLGGTDEADGIPLRGRIDRILDTFVDIPQDVEAIVNNLKVDYAAMIKKLNDDILKLDLEKQKSDKKTEIDKIDGELKPYLDKLAGQAELKKLSDQLGTENNKYQEALTLEKQFKSFRDDYNNVRVKIAGHLKARYQSFKDIVANINEKMSEIGNEIKLDAKLFFPANEFQFYDQVNKASISDTHPFYKVFKDGYADYNELLKLFDEQMYISQDGKFTNHTGTMSFPMRGKASLEDIIRGLVQSKFVIDYTVSYKGDELLKMSPGKKGTVLLILFLQLSSAQYPILIDQPEDNLDNRTIYDLLCDMIKKKKKERQIIIVSHNANLVIATDSENIIVANQAGQNEDASAADTKFTYVNGSLEYTYSKNDKESKILYQQGIREHACDILEGGDIAFKQRERKYSIK